MTANPTEGTTNFSYLKIGYFIYLGLVVTLLIVNSDDLSPTLFDEAFKTAGVDTISYAPLSASLPESGWPTLGDILDAGKPLISFLTTTADFTTVPYLIDGT